MYENSTDCTNSKHYVRIQYTRASARHLPRSLITAPCPILAAFLFLRLGWDSSNQYSSHSPQLCYPPSKLSSRLRIPKNRPRNGSHRSPSSQRLSRRSQRNSAHSHQDRSRSSLFPKPPHSLNADRSLRGLLGPCRKNRPNGKIVHRLTQ